MDVQRWERSAWLLSLENVRTKEEEGKETHKYNLKKLNKKGKRELKEDKRFMKVKLKMNHHNNSLIFCSYFCIIESLL